MTEEIKKMNLSEMLFNRDERLLNYITNLQKEKDNYKQRNEKAIECIKEWWYEKNTRDINRIVSLGDKRIDLLNILQGENDD